MWTYAEDLATGAAQLQPCNPREPKSSQSQNGCLLTDLPDLYNCDWSSVQAGTVSAQLQDQRWRGSSFENQHVNTLKEFAGVAKIDKYSFGSQKNVQIDLGVFINVVLRSVTARSLFTLLLSLTNGAAFRHRRASTTYQSDNRAKKCTARSSFSCLRFFRCCGSSGLGHCPLMTRKQMAAVKRPSYHQD
nr:hypothetical protein CFP56_76537 [Quercus suber]